MNRRTRRSLFISSAVALCALAAGVGVGCGDDGGGAGPGAGGSGSSSSSSSSSGGGEGTGGGGGASGAGGSQGAGGAGCHGDAAAWATLTKEPVACAKNSDCCVIINSCINEAQVVSATNTDPAKAAWPYCDNLCTNCLPPAVKVECVSQQCVGYKVPFDPNNPPELMMDHCGVDAPPLMLPSPGTHFLCGG